MSDSKDRKDDFEKAVEETGKRVSPSERRVLQVDVAKYQRLLDSEDLSEAQKRQLIETLWSIIVSFVELGFGVHPVQDVWTEGSEGGSEPSVPQADRVYLEHGLNEDFQDVTGERKPPGV